MKNKKSLQLCHSASVENDCKSKNEIKNLECDENSSSDSVLEIQLNEHVKRSELSDLDIRSLLVKCSACDHPINFLTKEVKKHRKLGVVTCEKCYDFYGSDEFSQDESGYNYCTWCGNGGKLTVCDYCPNGFCNPCIRRNFGRAEIKLTAKEGWRCYCCDRKRLKPKINFCNFILDYKQKRKHTKTDTHPKVRMITNGSAEEWLLTAFEESDEACKTFHRKMSKLKSIGISKSKSLKHVVAKMEELINSHKTDLKRIATSLSKRYASHIECKVKAEQESKTTDSTPIKIELDSTPEKGHAECSTPEKEHAECSTRGKEDAESIVLDNKNNVVSDLSPSILQPANASEEKIQAKLRLLKSSSESEGDKAQASDKDVSFVDIDNHCDGNMDVDKNESDLPNALETNSVNPESTVKNTDKHETSSVAKRKLNFTFSDSSDSDFIDKVDFKKIENVLDEKLEKKDSDENGDQENDPKLKLQVRVELTRCDSLLKSGETCLKIEESDIDKEEELDKLVDSLCKLPKMTKSKPQAKKRSVPRTAAAKKSLLESSSSISLSSEEDEDQKKIVIEKKKPVQETAISEIESAAHQDSNDSDLSLDSDVEDKKKRKKSKSNKKDDGSSSDDFVLPKKKKYDKLLHAPLLSDDEKKPKEKREKKASRKRKILSSEEEKRKKKSDGMSDTTTTSEDELVVKRSKKRRRIKKVCTSSDEDEDDAKEGSQEQTPGKGRKNIRKIVSQKKLAGSTKEAQIEEKERRKRIQERQKLYNKIEDMSCDGKEIVTKKMVLEVDPDSKEEIVEIHPDLVCKLKPHQVEGVKFMWECTIETVKDLKKPGSGCILAHCMGLGKTLQVITFLHTCLSNRIVKKEIKRAMIICPYNVALNWSSEFDHWLEDVESDIIVHQLTSAKTNIDRLEILKYWFSEGGVIIMSYELFRRLASGSNLKKKLKEQLFKYMLDPGPDIVVCDEGHVLKNEKSAISVATAKLRTRRRIVLTGTPLQNNLKEYHCMLSFVKPNLLGTVSEFRNRFVNPIMNGQYDDSNAYDVKLMKKRIHILHKLLEGCVQRCDYSALTKFLPTKHEFVISVKLSEVQMKMYECYLGKILKEKQEMAQPAGSTLFVDFTNLRCIWTHPYICHTSHVRQETNKWFKEEKEEELEEDRMFINDSEESSAKSTSESDDDKFIEKYEQEIKENNEKKKYRTRRAIAEGEVEEEEEEDHDVPEVPEPSKQWYHEFITDDDKYKIELSGKMVLLVEILKECEAIGDKVVLFSQSLLTLDMIEDILEHLSSQHYEKTKDVKVEDMKVKDIKTEDIRGTWIKGLDYFRMDGTTTADFRKNYIDMFNDPSNDRSRLFLISTRAGSLGTNLVGANRVIIFDTSWNPSHDVQAIFRVYRFGQLKPVYIYRLLAQGTMEEKIYDRQVTKLSLSCRVVDEQQIDRHFSAADLMELYRFDRNSTSVRPTPMVPKDRLLAELLIKHNDWIVTYHEHDSLLQNQNEEDLTEEERQAAWQEYENEREGRLPESNTILKDFDFTNLPDFTQDYEGTKVPDITMMVKALYEETKLKMPNKVNTIDFKRKILFDISRIRKSFQEMHVKLLREKQEYCAQGPVPAGLNKYMAEITKGLTSTGEYINRLSQAITAEEKLQFQRQMQANFQRAAATQAFLYRQGVQNAVRGQYPQRTVFIAGRNPTGFNTSQFRAPTFSFQGRPAYVYSAKPQPRETVPQPKVIEADDNTPTSTAASVNKTTTVTIEEIT